MMREIENSSVVRRTDQCLETQLDGEIIIMHVGTGMIYAVSDTANEIWTRLKAPTSFAAIVDGLLREYDVERSICTAEVASFLGELEKLGMVAIEPAPEADP